VNASSESSIAMPPPFENMTRSIVRPSRMKHVRLVAELFGASKQRAHQSPASTGSPLRSPRTAMAGESSAHCDVAKGWRTAKPWR